MNAKPGDLLISVIGFFGMLIPGAVFAILHGELLLGVLGVGVRTPDGTGDWFAVFIVAFILGNLLLGFSVPLNIVAGRFGDQTTQRYYEAVETRGNSLLPPGVERRRDSVFYAAFTYIRLKSPEALAEIERQAGEYKLFRSLTLLFIIDIPLSALSGDGSWSRVAFDVVLASLCFYRFQWLHDWCYRLVFDFYYQLTSTPADPAS